MLQQLVLLWIPYQICMHWTPAGNGSIRASLASARALAFCTGQPSCRASASTRTAELFSTFLCDLSEVSCHIDRTHETLGYCTPTKLQRSSACIELLLYSCGCRQPMSALHRSIHQISSLCDYQTTCNGTHWETIGRTLLWCQSTPRSLLSILRQGLHDETWPCATCTTFPCSWRGPDWSHMGKFWSEMPDGTGSADREQWGIAGGSQRPSLCCHPVFCLHQTFKRKQELVRHLRQSHGSEWNAIERMAVEMMTSLPLTKRCYCVPVQQHTKHICLIFLQYSMARLIHEREQQLQSDDLPPDVTLTTWERVEQLMWMGCGHYIYKIPDLKLSLTVTCVLCGMSCRTGDNLALHLYDKHHEDIANCSAILRLVHWDLFERFGCLCNPSRGYGTPSHLCPSLLQIALISAAARWDVAIPWVFRTNKVLSYIGDLLPLDALRRVALNLMTRQFGRLWQDRDLVTVLRSYCIFCGEQVPLAAIKAHVRLSHRFGTLEVQAMIEQVSAAFLTEHSEDERCDLCGDLLSFSPEDLVPMPAQHLPQCHLVLQFALFLMHPVLHREPSDPERWPTRQEIADAYQTLDLQRAMHNVRNPATEGQDFDTLVTCGLQMLQDTHLQEIITHQCLICGKCFFMANKFIQHVLTHNYKQMNAMWCLRRLCILHQPCHFCGFDAHQGAHTCAALLNLAVLLTNGRRARQRENHLGWTSLTRSDPDAGHLRLQGEWTEQAAQEKGTTEVACFNLHALLQRDVGASGSDGTPTRGQYDGITSRVGVHHSHGPRASLTSAHSHENAPELEGEPKGADTTPLHDAQCDGNSAGEIGETVSVSAHGGNLCGMHQVWTGGLQSEHAVPEMGPISTEAHAEQRESTPNWRSAQDHAECGEDPPDGPFGGTEISCHDQAAAGRSSSENSAVSADHWQQDEWRTVEHTAQHLLSLHLAACPLYTETTDAAEKQSWETTPENAVRDPRDDQVKKLVRVLMNTTGTACYINAFMVALSWCTLLTHSLTSNVWQFGFELMRGLTQWSCVPLNVQLFPPFRWLLTGVWSDDELLAQQDIIEFGSILLSRLQPTFISCRWTTRVQHVTKEVDTHLDSENGPQYSPILIRFQTCMNLAATCLIWSRCGTIH